MQKRVCGGQVRKSLYGKDACGSIGYQCGEKRGELWHSDQFSAQRGYD